MPMPRLLNFMSFLFELRCLHVVGDQQARTRLRITAVTANSVVNFAASLELAWAILGPRGYRDVTAVTPWWFAPHFGRAAITAFVGTLAEIGRSYIYKDNKRLGK